MDTSRLLRLFPLTLMAVVHCDPHSDQETSCLTPALPSVGQGISGFAMTVCDDGMCKCGRFDIYLEALPISARDEVLNGAKEVFENTPAAERVRLQSSNGIFVQPLRAGDYLLVWLSDTIHPAEVLPSGQTSSTALPRAGLVFSLGAQAVVEVTATYGGGGSAYRLWTNSPDANGATPRWCENGYPPDCT